ncbi:hypothetical protein LP7551_04139 [Roseibium album]|nr:hypothetical protein LP7551_04139 [Roseibium album]
MSDTITRVVFIKASRETVWSYLVDKDKLGEWYHPAERDLAIDKDYALFEESSEDHKQIIWGRVLEMNRPQLLITTFNIAPFNGIETKLTWVLKEAAGGSRVSLTHEGIAKASGEAAMEMLLFLKVGWDNHLEKLQRAIVE